MARQYKGRFDGVSVKNYFKHVRVVAEVKLLLEKWLPENYDFQLYFQGNEVTVDVYVLSLRLISGKEGNNLLGMVRRRLLKVFSALDFKLNAKIGKKNELNSGTIALSLAQAIVRRRSVNTILKDFSKTVMSSARFKGMLVQIKGRFKSSPRAAKTIYSVGNLTLQELDSKIDYKQVNVTGKYGTSCIKVFLNLV